MDSAKFCRRGVDKGVGRWAPPFMSTAFQVAGLASNFDWKTFVDQLMDVQHAPADRLANEKARNNQKVTLLAEFGSRITALETAVTTLGASGTFGARTAVSDTTASTWLTSAATGTMVGAYKIAVSQLATAAHRDGAANIGTRLSATSDVSLLTLADLPIGSAVTAGKFIVNGATIDVELTDSLQDILTAITTETGGNVTATYDPTADKIVLTGYDDPDPGIDPIEVVLGAANDTSNFLAAMKLGNNGTAGVESSGRLGTVKTSASLASANLTTAITAVDGLGAGSFIINGVTIDYNVNDDSLSGILTRINQSGAGVTAKYDAASDQVSLTNNTTGDIGIAISEAAGGLLGALGLTGGGTLVHGDNAEFKLNDGVETLSSLSNNLTATAHGVTGLSVTVNSLGTQTIDVASDGAGMRAKVADFIAKFNSVQSFIEGATKVSTDSKGKVTAALLADNREIQAWGTSLRSTAFAAVSGISGTIARLENLGIDFTSGTNELEIADSAKLDAALRDAPEAVETFFDTATTGFVDKISELIASGETQTTTQRTNLNTYNTSLDAQIADIERRLDQQREIMESAFINMEMAQSTLKSQQAALTNAFPTTTK